MATLIFNQQQRTTNDKIKQKQQSTTAFNIFPTTQRKQQQQQLQHHHYYSNKKQRQNHVIKEEDDVDGNEDVDGDFYHIKCCYQPTKTTIALTKSGTLNQRTKYNPTALVTLAATSFSLSHVLNSLSYNCCRSFVTISLMIYLLLVQYAMAAPQSCILCDKNDLLAKDPQTNYEEFLFEHQVTRQDAINALRQLNDSFYEGTSSDSSCNGVRCTEKVMKYCLGPQFINDHCWCEVGHSTEGLPFVPHICYVGEKIYKTSVGSCFFYEEVKDCCCSSVLAKEWRHISAGSSVYSKAWLHNYYVLAVISLIYLLIRRLYSY